MTSLAQTLPDLTRLREMLSLVAEQVWFAVAVALGLGLSFWVCAMAGLPSALPFPDLLVL